MATTADSVVVNLEARTDQYNAKINQAAATFTRATDSIDKNSARAQNATRNLGRQIGDIGTGLATGQNPFFIIAQQSAQVADALADTGGRAAKVATFFAGPWGAALLAAGSALGILVGNMLETGDSVESLVAKLQDSEQKTRLAAEADRIFAATQEGLESRIRETTKAINDQIRSLRSLAEQQNISARRDADIAQNSAQSAASRLARAEARIRELTNRPLGVGVSDAQIAQRNRQLTDARGEAAAAREDARLANIEANRSRVFLARERARQNATPEGRLNSRFDELSNTASRNAIAAAQAGAQVGARTQNVLQYIETARQKALEDLRESEKKDRKSGRKGPSAETLARRAEVARVREVRNNEAFNNELEQFNAQIINAQRERANTAEEAARFEREAIETEFRKRREQIAADLSAKKFDAAEAATLNERNEYVKALRLRNVAINEDIRTLQDIAEGQRVDIGVLQESAQARLAIAETQEERKNIELELIRLKYQERKEQLEILKQQAVIRGDLQAQANINRQLEALPDLERADKVGVDQRNRGRYENYRRNLDSADGLKDSIDGIKIQTLEAVTDELTNATKAALGLKGAFGDIVGELIRIGIQRKLIGPLADALFGPAGGQTPGTAGGGKGFLSDFFAQVVSSLGKRASGGNTRGGGAYLVGENGPELFAPSGSGKIYPTGALGSPSRAGGNTIVQQTFVLDNRGGITTPQLIDYVNRTANASATRAGQAAYNSSPLRSAQIEAFGT